jgi:O-antigen/teichoic acid export membrane protein
MKKDILIYFGGKIIPALVNLAIIIMAVRFLGKTEYGKYSLVFYATSLLGTLSFGWIHQSIIRFLSAYPDEQVLVINRFFFLTIMSTLSAFIIGIFLCLFYFHLNWTESILVVVYIFMYNVFLFHLILNQTRRRPLNYTILEGSYNLFFLVAFLFLVFILNQHLFIVLFIAMVAGLLLTEFLRITILPGGRVGLDPTHIYFDTAFSKKVFHFGSPITIWLILSYLMIIADRYIINEFRNYDDVGTYAAIKDFIIKIATFTTIPVILAYHPMIVEKWNENRRKESLKLIRQGLNYMLLIAVAVFVFFMFFRDLFFSGILHLQVDSDFLVSVALIGSAFLWQAAMLLHKPLELLLKPRLMLLAIIVALVANTLGNLFFIPAYGYPAAAVVSLASVILYIIIIFTFLFHFRRQGLLK